MFDKKSDYALNKREKDAIVYTSVTGTVYLTREDFNSENEFLKWKNWSDGAYQTSEQSGRSFYDNTISLDEKLDVIGAVLSVETELAFRQSEIECAHVRATLLEQIKNCLTEKQFRRLWLLHVECLTLTAIAATEGVSEASVSESISSARKNIIKFIEKHPIKMPIFL